MRFFRFTDTKKNIQDLVLETRNYVGLQKQVYTQEFSHRLSQLLSSLAVLAIGILSGGIVLLFFSFFVAYLIGQYTGSTALGFGCITVVLVLALVIIWLNRMNWICAPIARLVAEAFSNGQEEYDTTLRTKADESKNRISQLTQHLVGPNSSTEQGAENITRLASGGMLLYRGFRIGLALVSAYRLVFGKKRSK